MTTVKFLILKFILQGGEKFRWYYGNLILRFILKEEILHLFSFNLIIYMFFIIYKRLSKKIDDQRNMNRWKSLRINHYK